MQSLSPMTLPQIPARQLALADAHATATPEIEAAATAPRRMPDFDLTQGRRIRPPLASRRGSSLRSGLWPWGPILATAVLLTVLLSVAPWPIV